MDSFLYYVVIQPIIKERAAEESAKTQKCYYDDCMPTNYKDWKDSKNSINKNQIEPEYNKKPSDVKSCQAIDTTTDSSNSSKFADCKNFCDNVCCKNKDGDCEKYIDKQDCLSGAKKQGCPSNNPVVKAFNWLLSALGIDPGIASLIVKFILFIIFTSFNIKIAPEFGRMFKPDGGGFFATAAGELLIIVGLSLLNFKNKN